MLIAHKNELRIRVPTQVCEKREVMNTITTQKNYIYFMHRARGRKQKSVDFTPAKLSFYSGHS